MLTKLASRWSNSAPSECLGSTLKSMLNYLCLVYSISAESIVLVEAEIVKAAEEVKSCTISDAELKISQIHVIAEAEPRLPFTMEDASRPESELENEDAQFSRVALDTRLNNRVLDLRVSIGVAWLTRGVCRTTNRCITV
jgi:aspartyl/asparaginyl-tRNA synthetase